MFRPSRSSSGPQAKTVTQQVQYIHAYVIYCPVTKICKHLGSHNAGKLNSTCICLLGGPEDDLLGRNVSLWQIYHCV